MMSRVKELRYRVMLALYLPILLYAFSTYQLDDTSFVVQELEPMVVGQETVVLGQPYNARAFLKVGGNEGQQLTAEGNLEVIGDSLFQMQTAQLLDEEEDEREVSYSGTFRFQQVDGSQVEIPVEGQYNVRRPEIVAVSEATQALYRQTRNDMRFDVPGLEDRQLRLYAGGQRVEGRTISISPTGDQSRVDVYLVDSDGEDDIFLGSREFSVIDPPRPQIRVLNAGREVSSGDNIPRQRAVLEFEIQPDEEFRQRYPDDARYRATQATVYLQRGLTASEQIGTFDLQNGGQLMLTRALREAETGDRITVRLEGIQRINHAGQAISVPLNQGARTFGFTLS